MPGALARLPRRAVAHSPDDDSRAVGEVRPHCSRAEAVLALERPVRLPALEAVVSIHGNLVFKTELPILAIGE